MTKEIRLENSRPDFAFIKSYQEFSQYYWYRDELQKICKKLGVDSSGLKAELNHNIEEYFKGNLISPKKRAVRKVKQVEEITLDTGLVECGFCFSQRFRDFFAQQTGVKNFKFNADMVATAKKVKQEGDVSFKLRDMLDIYYGKKEYVKYDPCSCQWNRFLKEFCADKDNAIYPNKLKAAAGLWEEVRNSTKEKVYTKNLRVEYEEKMKQYL